MNSNFQLFTKVLFVFFTIFTIVATSTTRDDLRDGTYTITSDCPDASKKNGIIEASFTIENFTDGIAYGLPNVPLSTHMSDAKRTCRGVILGDDKSYLNFICTNNETSEIECTITLTAE